MPLRLPDPPRGSPFGKSLSLRAAYNIHVQAGFFIGLSRCKLACRRTKDSKKRQTERQGDAIAAAGSPPPGSPFVIPLSPQPQYIARESAIFLGLSPMQAAMEINNSYAIMTICGSRNIKTDSHKKS
jgi:hypothetical protein